MALDPGTELAAVAPAEVLAAEADTTVASGTIGQWGLVWRRFKRHRLAVWSGWLLLGLLALAIVGPLVVPPLSFNGVSGTTVIQAHAPRLWPLSFTRIMGTDGFGNGIAVYVLAGFRPALEVGIIGALIASVVGALIGGIAGYFGRIVDTVLMRLVDALLTIPFLPLLLLINLYLVAPSPLTYGIIFGLVGWAGVARLVRSYVLSLREREYAVAARALGVSDIGVIFRHLLPNALDVLVVATTLNVALFIVANVSLDFLGAGQAAFSTVSVTPGATPTITPTWGMALAGAFNNMIYGYWWMVVFPCAALLPTVLAVNLLGDGLRDALDTTSYAYLASGKPMREGRLERAFSVAMHGVGRSVAAVRAAVLGPLGRVHAVGTWRRGVQTAEVAAPAGWAERRLGSLPLWLRLAPPAVALLIGTIAFLLGHSPLVYPPNYAPPVTYALAESETPYSGIPHSGGRWDLFLVDRASRLIFERVRAGGHVLQREQVAGSGGIDPEAVLAEGHGRAVGVWLTSDQSRLDAAFLGTGRPRAFPLTPGGGSVEHPTVLAVRGGFEALFGWQRLGTGPYKIYRVFIPSGARHPSLPRVLINSRVHGLLPRAALDGSGALDVLDLEHSLPDFWAWRFQRFSLEGKPLGRATHFGTFEFTVPGPNGPVPAIPVQWAADLERAPDGSVWGAWVYQGQTTVAHWSRNGRMVVPPTVVPGGDATDARGAALPIALAPTSRGGQVYYAESGANGGSETIAAAQGFDELGNPVAPIDERVAYDGGGQAALPQAGLAGGRIQATWERTRTEGAIVEGTAFHRHQPPDVLTRLGLNIGNPWANVLVVALGTLFGGLGIAVANVISLAILIGFWLVLSRVLPPRLAWWLYFAGIAGFLVWVFALQSAPPVFVVIISGLGPWEKWIAVAGGVLLAVWSGFFLFRRPEPIFRAALTGFAAIYFVAAMEAVILIQQEITRI